MATAAKNRRSSFYRGEEGSRKSEEELVRQKAAAEARKEQGNMPFRFRVPVGGTAQFVIVDDAPDFYRFEHCLKNPRTGFWEIFTGCVKEWDNCPVCQTAERESYYAMYLTVIDFTPFTTRDGDKVEFSRKLLVVKPAQQKKFLRAYAKAQKDGGTLRGALFEATRDGEKDSAIGNDIEFIEYVEEDELLTYERSWKDKDKKKHTELCHEPLDYEALFEEPDVEALRVLVGAPPTPGSRAHEDKELGRRPRRGAAKDEEYEPAERNSRMSSGRRSRPAAEDEAEAEEDAAPRRGARRSAREEPAEEPAQTSRRPARGRREEPEDEAPPARRPAARRSPRDEPEEEPEAEAPARGSRRTARDEPEEPPYDDEPPARGSRAPGVGRRVVARGNR